jgi:ribosomal protein L6P/L9E
MSRIGRKPIVVPAGVDITIDGATVTVKGRSRWRGMTTVRST